MHFLTQINRIKFRIRIKNNVPGNITAFADVRMLEIIIRNLLSNALKFTHRKGIVNINATQKSDDSIEICVSDSGIGMNKELLDNLFRLDANIKRQGTEEEPSTGLGLQLCKEFIDKHGGKIWVESEEGKGSRFYFTLHGSG